jgi:hypothetical protein
LVPVTPLALRMVLCLDFGKILDPYYVVKILGPKNDEVSGHFRVLHSENHIIRIHYLKLLLYGSKVLEVMMN